MRQRVWLGRRIDEVGDGAFVEGDIETLRSLFSILGITSTLMFVAGVTFSVAFAVRGLLVLSVIVALVTATMWMATGLARDAVRRKARTLMFDEAGRRSYERRMSRRTVPIWHA